MSPEPYLAMLIVIGMLGLLMMKDLPADAVFLGGLALFLTLPIPDPAGGVRFGIITVQEALSGFSNPGVITIGFLFIVVAGLVQTGATFWIANKLIGQPRGLRQAMVRTGAPVILLSAFLNNTPIVAMLIPIVRNLAKKLQVSPSKLMIPLSYFAILGGTCTLIGTSTNLVLNGLLISETGHPGLSLFSITPIGLPVAIFGLLFLVIAGPKLLPSHISALDRLRDLREYMIEMIVPIKSPLAGKSIARAGLRHLPGAFLAGIIRDEDQMVMASPNHRLLSNDRLVFTGTAEGVRDLHTIRGLVPATDQVFKLDSPRYRRNLFEAVVSGTSPLTGRTIREGKFRNRYNAVVLGVARNDERVDKKIGDIVLEPGDTLLVEANTDFYEQEKDSRDFFLVRPLEDSTPIDHDRAWVSLSILAGLLAVVTTGILSIEKAAILAALLVVITRCCTVEQARKSIEWPVLFVIAAALAIGEGLATSGAASLLADQLLALTRHDPMLSLFGIYIVTSLLTALITNNAAVAMVFPIALTTANALGVDFMPYLFAIMMAGSASFATPIGYQTNLMVYGPGGYRFRDYLKIGIPMSIFVGIVTIAILLVFWEL